MHRTMKIFLSYKSEDRPFVQQLRERLIGWGYETWMDVFDIPKGANWPDEIDAGLNACDVVLGVLSPLAVKSRNVKNEWDWAIVYNKPLVLLMHEPCYVPMHYISINYISFVGEAQAAGFDQLKTALDNLNGQPAQTTPPPDSYRDYLTRLYERINLFLSQKLIARESSHGTTPEPIRLRSAAAQGMVDALFEKREEIDPLFAVGGLAEAPSGEYDDFAKAFAYYEGQVLLLGAPGAGKTITLLHYGRDAVVARMQDPKRPLPILGIIPTWDAGKQPPLVDWLAKSYGAPPDTKAIIESGGALLLLDGLDELGGEREDPETQERYDPRARFMTALADVVEADRRVRPVETLRSGTPGITHQSSLTGNQILVTCRPQDYAAIGEKIKLKGAVTLKPLEPSQVQTYLSQQPHLLDAITQDERLGEMLETPLLLSLFAFAYQDMSEAERQQFKNLQHAGDVRDKIFEAYIRKRYEHETNKLKLRGERPPFTLEEIYEVLGHVAMLDANNWDEDNLIRHSYFRQVLGDQKIDAFTSWMTQLHILVWNGQIVLHLSLHYGTTQYENSWRFIHLFLRDYLVYQYCLPRLFDPSFYPEFGELERKRDEGPAEALGNIRDPRAIKSLYKILADKTLPARIRSSAIYAVGKMGDRQAVPQLIQSLVDTDETVRISAAYALGRSGSNEAIQPLIAALKHDPKWSVRVDAALALGRFSNPDTVMDLVQALADSHYMVRAAAAFALGEMGDLRAVDPLILCLQDENPSLRHRATQALGKLHDTRAVIPLTTVLTADSVWARRAAAESLGSLGDEHAVPTLIHALQDYDDEVRLLAASALKQIGTPEALAAVAEAQEMGRLDQR